MSESIRNQRTRGNSRRHIRIKLPKRFKYETLDESRSAKPIASRSTIGLAKALDAPQARQACPWRSQGARSKGSYACVSNRTFRQSRNVTRQQCARGIAKARNARTIRCSPMVTRHCAETNSPESPLHICSAEGFLRPKISRRHL